MALRLPRGCNSYCTPQLLRYHEICGALSFVVPASQRIPAYPIPVTTVPASIVELFIYICGKASSANLPFGREPHSSRFEFHISLLPLSIDNRASSSSFTAAIMLPKADPFDLMHPVPLLIELHATVLNSWYDSDGYGNTDTDFWTMTLHVPSWGPKSELRARIRSHEPLDSNGLYSIKGRMYIDPGKEWTDTYVRIDSAQKFQGPGNIRSDMLPTFEVFAQIRAVHDTYFSIRWVTWDGYQNARYDQRARANIARRIPRSHTFIDLHARITGTMNGPDHKGQWQCSCIEPGASIQPPPSDYLDTIVHGLSTVHAMTHMS